MDRILQPQHLLRDLLIIPLDGKQLTCRGVHVNLQSLNYRFISLIRELQLLSSLSVELIIHLDLSSSLVQQDQFISCDAHLFLKSVDLILEVAF